VDTAYSGLLRCRPVVLRWTYGSCRMSYGNAPEKAGVVSHPGAPRLFKKKLKPPGPLPGERRCIPIQCGACRCCYGVIPVGTGVHTVAPETGERGFKR